MADKKPIGIRVDNNLCVGSGMCVSSHPDKFAIQPDGHAKYIAIVLDEAAAREAEELCPVSAISLISWRGTARSRNTASAKTSPRPAPPAASGSDARVLRSRS